MTNLFAKTISKFNLISIKNAQLKSIIEVSDEVVSDSYTMRYQNTQPVHTDLTAAMEKLRFHVEKICGTCFPDLQVEGYFRQACGELELLTIYAAIRTENSCPMSLSARLKIGEDTYAWIDQLLEDLSLCEREALLYIQQGKRFGLESFVQMSEAAAAPLTSAA